MGTGTSLHQVINILDNGLHCDWYSAQNNNHTTTMYDGMRVACIYILVCVCVCVFVCVCVSYLAWQNWKDELEYNVSNVFMILLLPVVLS